MLITLAILLDGIVFASYLFLVSIGLTLIFGVMKILNAAHGSFYAFGAYCAATVIGLYFGWLLGGTVLVETVFDWPGIGLYATKAITTQDYMPIMGVTLCIGALFVAVNLLVDLAYGLVNPKVRLA